MVRFDGLMKWECIYRSYEVFESIPSSDLGRSKVHLFLYYVLAILMSK
jgi:hypothetical protein